MSKKIPKHVRKNCHRLWLVETYIASWLRGQLLFVIPINRLPICSFSLLNGHGFFEQSLQARNEIFLDNIYRYSQHTAFET